MQAVIMAGGKGSRVAKLTKNEIPKPMLPINNRPILEWQLEKLKEYGFDEIILVIGYLGEKIKEYFKDGSQFGVSIRYVVEEEPLGTAGAFYYLRDIIHDDNFMLVFGDVFFDIDIDRMMQYHISRNALATLFVHPNSHPYDSDLIMHDKNMRVLGFDSKNNVRDYWYDNLVNAGLYCLNKDILKEVSVLKKTDFEKELLSELIKEHKPIYAYKSAEYVKDIGTVDRINSFLNDLNSGIVSRKCLKNKQAAIFLDRDGTINKLKDFIYMPEDLELIDCSIEAIKRINSSHFLAVVVTNQPSVARGLCDEEELNIIHNKLRTLLGNQGAYIDELYYCPHHPDKGFEGEREEYKIKCNCRKPDIGMLKKAELELNIDLKKSYMIGDSLMDIEMADRAGMKSILVRTGLAGSDNKYNAEPEYICENILDAVNFIIEELD